MERNIVAMMLLQWLTAWAQCKDARRGHAFL